MTDCEVRICVDWAAYEGILTPSKIAAARDSCLGIVKSVSPNAILTDFIVVECSSTDWATVVSKSLDKIIQANSRRLIMIPICGCLVTPVGTACSSSSIIKLFKLYSNEPTIATSEMGASGIERILDCGMSLTLSRSPFQEVNLPRFVAICSKVDIIYYDSLSIKMVTNLMASTRHLVLCSCRNPTSEELLLSLYNFSVATNNSVLVSPDLKKYVARKKLVQVAYAGQVYYGKTECSNQDNVDSPYSLELPIPVGVPAQSYLLD